MYTLTCTKAKNVVQFSHRTFFHWLNIMFNKVDEDRRANFGPDRTCAEWLLRNGAKVKFVDQPNYLVDYNKLPAEKLNLYIQEIDATNASISHYGFPHFQGCKFIKKIIFEKCYYLEDQALQELHPLKESLIYLRISSCLNITEEGLVNLSSLTNLKDLHISDLPYVKDKDNILRKLQEKLSHCNVQIK